MYINKNKKKYFQLKLSFRGISDIENKIRIQTVTNKNFLIYKLEKVIKKKLLTKGKGNSDSKKKN